MARKNNKQKAQESTKSKTKKKNQDNSDDDTNESSGKSSNRKETDSSLRTSKSTSESSDQSGVVKSVATSRNAKQVQRTAAQEVDAECSDESSEEWEELETNELPRNKKTQRRRQSTYTARKSTKKTKKPFRFMTAREREVMFLKEVVKLQNMRQPMIPRAAFMRLIRELVLNTGRAERISDKAFDALQTAAETYITQILQDSYMLTMHRTRITLQVKDLKLLLVLRTRTDGLFV